MNISRNWSYLRPIVGSKTSAIKCTTTNCHSIEFRVRWISFGWTSPRHVEIAPRGTSTSFRTHRGGGRFARVTVGTDECWDFLIVSAWCGYSDSKSSGKRFHSFRNLPGLFIQALSRKEQLSNTSIEFRLELIGGNSWRMKKLHFQGQRRGRGNSSE